MAVERTLTELTTLPIEEKVSGVELRLGLAAEQELSNYIKAAYQQLKTDRTSLENEWADNVLRYEGGYSKHTGPWPGSSDLRPPLTRVVSDTLHAIYMHSLHGKNSKVKAVPIGPDDINKAKKNETYMKFQLDEEIGFRQVTDVAMSDLMGQTGNAFLEPRYVVEQEIREEEVTDEVLSNPDDPLSEKQTVTRVDRYANIVFDGVKADNINPEHIYAAVGWENAAEAAERDILIKLMPQSVEEIRRKAKGQRPKYHNVDMLDTLLYTRVDSESTMAKQKVDLITQTYLMGRKTINTAEAYLWWKVKPTQEERIIVTLDIESGVIFRVIKGRCRITHLKAFPIRGRFWGRSPISIVKPLQKHLDAIVNQRVDAGTIANLPHGFYRAGGTFNPQVFSFSPGNMYPVENPGDVAWAPTPKVDSSLYNEEAKVWEYIERLFGLNENVQGLQSRGTVTATEALEVSKRSAVKFGTPFNRIVDQLKPFLGHIHDLNYEWTPATKQYRVLGRDGLPVFHKYTRDDAKARLNYSIEVQTTFDEQLMRDTWILVWRLFRQDPQLALNRAFLYRFTEKAMSSLIGDTQPYLPVPMEAKLPSAEEAIQLLLMGERMEPKPGIDPENYMRIFADFINGEEFQGLRNDQQESIFGFFAKLKFMQETFDKFGLNMDGKFDGLMEQMGGKLPPVSVGQNPSNKFNQTRVGPGNNGGQGAETSSQLQGVGIDRAQ